MLKNADYNVDYVDVNDPEKFKDYKVLYFPNYSMLDSKVVPFIEEFLKNGGTVLADEGFGMRQPNTWMNPYDIDCKPIMTARMRERRLIRDYEEVNVNGIVAKFKSYKTEYKVENAEEILTFKDGTPALQAVNCGKGKIYLFGFSPAYSYFSNGDKIWQEFIDNMMSNAGIKKYKYSDFENGIYEKRLTNGENEIIFIFNNSNEDKQFEIENKIIASGGFGNAKEKLLCVPKNSMAYVVTKK